MPPTEEAKGHYLRSFCRDCASRRHHPYRGLLLHHVIAAASGSVTVEQSRRFWVRHRHCFLHHRRPWSSSPPESRAELLIVAAGVTGIATASSNVATVAADLPQSKFSVTALVVSAFDSIKFDVAASVIGVGDAAIVPVVLESPLLLRV
ncbi:uncharacterized protein DS421_18g612580 [Arachis hypogaea]|nr:uncharacterized protein DS421_18g612580 [Arachis hypogaea]